MLNHNPKISGRFFHLSLLSLLLIWVQGNIKANIDGHEFECSNDDSVFYTAGTFSCMVPSSSTIFLKDQPIFGEPDTLPLPNLLAVKLKHSDVPYHTTTLRDLLWPELVTLPNRTIEDEDGREIHLYENITISSLLPNEESILSCVFDMLLLHADAQANGFKIEMINSHRANFNVHPSSPYCYLPSLVYSARKVLHGYRNGREYKGMIEINDEYKVCTYGMIELAKLVFNFCQLKWGLIYSIKHLQCRDPRFQLLYEMLYKSSDLTTTSFLDIASLVSVFPDLPWVKKEKWLRYLEYRGYKDATKAENPVVAFVDGVVHPLFSYFAPHAVLLDGREQRKKKVESELLPAMGMLQDGKAGGGSEKPGDALILSSEQNKGLRGKMTMRPSVYSIMGVTEPYTVHQGGEGLVRMFRRRKPLGHYDNNASRSLQTQRERFMTEKHVKHIRQNFYTRTRKRTEGTVEKKKEDTTEKKKEDTTEKKAEDTTENERGEMMSKDVKGTALQKAEETGEKKPRIANFTVISLPLYSWRTAQDNVLDGKSREEILHSLTRAVKEKIKKFSTEFAKCNMERFIGDPTTTLQFLGEHKPPKLPKSVRKPLLSHEKRVSLAFAARASYHFMKKRNPSSHKKFLEVHPLVLKALLITEKNELNTFILANCVGNRHALHTALDAAFTFYITFLHFTFYDEMRAFDRSFVQLEEKRAVLDEELFDKFKFDSIVKKLPLITLPTNRSLQ